MDDMQRLTTAACADLERLAAAAATMGYSSDSITVSTHHLPNTVPSSTLPASVASSHYSDACDLSRTQHFPVARISEYQPRAVYDQSRTPQPSVTHHQQQQHHISTSAQAVPRSTTQYVVERANFNQLSNRPIHYATVAPVTDNTNTIPVGVQYAEVKAVNSISSGIPLAQASLIPTTATTSSSLITHAVTQAMMNFAQEDGGIDSISVVPEPQEKKKKREKRAKRQVKEKKDETPLDEDAADDPLADPVPVSGDQKIAFTEIRVPEPILMDGRKYYNCKLCDQKFLRKYQFQRHLISHTGEKRGALSLENKVEIIRRIQKGEKQVDLAMEYNVGRSTLSFIMKHSEKFLGVWKNGKFHPDSKRLRGAQREDVEEALYEWYKQAMQISATVTGTILRRKAKDFAIKLGYKEFKATNGWLDRFKHRKSIVLGRGKPNKDKENQEDPEDLKGDFVTQVLPSILMEYESNNVFHADETGMLYRILPNKTASFKRNRCAGGSKSKHRLTVLMCSNMSGTEKFPLLVIGKHPNPKCFKNVKSLPVHYMSNPKSWMTMESFLAWLHDLDAFFVQQNRKVLLILPNLPVHPKAPKLNAIRIIISPSAFVGPFKLGVTHSLKRHYRRSVLETLLNLMDEENAKKKRKGKNSLLHLSLLSYLHLLDSAWRAVTDVTISNSFQKSGVGKYSMWGMNLMPESNLGTENLELLHELRCKGFKIPDGVTFDEFVTFDDDVQVCHLMDDDDIIAAVTGADVDSSDSEDEAAVTSDKSKSGKVKRETNDNAEDADDGESCPAMAEVDASLSVLRQHIQYQEGAQEMIRVLGHLEYLINKGGNRVPVVISSSETAM